jgi:hypothetical protein
LSAIWGRALLHDRAIKESNAKLIHRAGRVDAVLPVKRGSSSGNSEGQWRESLILASEIDAGYEKRSNGWENRVTERFHGR